MGADRPPAPADAASARDELKAQLGALGRGRPLGLGTDLARQAVDQPDAGAETRARSGTSGRQTLAVVAKTDTDPVVSLVLDMDRDYPAFAVEGIF